MVLNGTASFGDVQAQWKPEDDIAEGQLLFLKGQLRILTVLSLLAVVHRRKATLSEATCQNMSKSSCKGEGCHICVPMSTQDSFCCVLIDMYVLDVVPANPGAKVHPTLQQTLQKVRCVHVELTNRKEELFLGWFYKFLVVFGCGSL